ncbi:hypothetical protein BGW39_005027 [Mortierella sp. 14UC]|nr:hypothetical protein BGW39_005027 [Mortierella sp. 14UC]
MISYSAYMTSLFNLEHEVAAWQRTEEHLDLSWPPSIFVVTKGFDFIGAYNSLKAIQADVKTWESTLQRVWRLSMISNIKHVGLLLSWSVTRLHYYRALFPVMDAYRSEYNIKEYYGWANVLMDTKGPSHQETLQVLQAMEANPTTDFGDMLAIFFEKNSHFRDAFSKTKDASLNISSSTTKHQIEPSENTFVHKKAKTEPASTALPGSGASKATQKTAAVETGPLTITAPTPTTLPPGNATSAALPSGSSASTKAPAPSFMSFTPLPTATTTTWVASIPTPTSLPTTSLSAPPASQGASFRKATPQPTHISPLQVTPAPPTSSRPSPIPSSAVRPTPAQSSPSQATPATPTSSQPAPASSSAVRPTPSQRSARLQSVVESCMADVAVAKSDEDAQAASQRLYEAFVPLTAQENDASPPQPAPVIQTQGAEISHAQYPSPVGSASPQQTSPPKAGDSLDKTTTTLAATSEVQPVPKQASSTDARHQKQQEQQQSPEQGELVSNKEDAEEDESVGATTSVASSQDRQDAAVSQKTDTQLKQQHHQQQPIAPVRLLQDKRDAEEIINAPMDNVFLQDKSGALATSKPTLALGPQDHQCPQQSQHQPPLSPHKETKPFAVASPARAEVNPTILLQDIKTWMETEAKKRKDESALLERLIIKNTLLETKLDEHVSKMEQETKRQEAHRAKTHSWDLDISSLKERSLAQDLKMSQMENRVESRMRQTLEQDILVVRNELQEERVDNLTKDLEVKRAETMETMAKARAEIRDARQMVAEAREERANAMERAARAEADNQMLLRVINELQGTGWRLSGQGHGRSHGQILDAGVQDQGGSPSIPIPTTQSGLRFDHHPQPLASGSPSSRFMRFGVSMQQSFSSSSTESLVEPTAAAATVADPAYNRMEVISVKLENEFISRLHVDPDMTEDDEGRTDTDGDATEEE